MILNRHFCYPKVERVSRKWRRELIENMTPSERLVFSYLKKLDYKVEIQKIIFYSKGKFYIVDFYLPDYKIVIEVDGKQHYWKEGIVNDKIRTKRLQQCGVLDVVRFSNDVCKRGEYFKRILSKKIINCINKHYGS